jgi:hemerythrin-like domain-containing protein
MKRSTALTLLSREHHAALVLAKQAQRLAQKDACSEDVFEFMRLLESRLCNELEPHFRVEETTLLTMLENAGHDEAFELALRARHEHDALRELARRVASRDLASLGLFGEQLAAHVRFEERELFGFAEKNLLPQQLASIEIASKNASSSC